MKNAIEVKNLTKSFSGFTLKDLTFTLPEGAILGLIGENGAGKSTTIKLLLHALEADSGSASVLNCDVKDPAYAALKNRIGVVLDEAYFPEVLTARQVGKVLRHAYSDWQDADYEAYLNRFSLPDDKMFRNYSRGMKMKLAIAAALSHKPQLLILDEATAGLDPLVRDEIVDLFYEFTRDPSHSILISSHIISDLEKLCDYVAFLHKGNLLFCEEKDALLDRYCVVHADEAALRALPNSAIKGIRKNPYGSEILLYAEDVPASLTAERPTLEKLILLLSKGDAAK
ncbi:MAG: ABC transporter ATP-binding protein [Clostridia bacterium]|nr:ABC transporter ATP-binding protein [Clostridia bacterium]